MEVLDVQMAVHVYRQLGDAGMVMGLERIAYVEDKNLLAGHVALLFGNYQTAQARRTSDSKPNRRSYWGTKGGITEHSTQMPQRFVRGFLRFCPAEASSATSE